MRIFLIAFIGILFLAGCGGEDAPPRLLLVGIDGGSWNLIDPRLAGGELPHLAALSGRGVTAELTSVEPLISPAAWTSIATGRSPEDHGITTFFGDRHAIRVPTVWERFAAGGLRVGLYDYLVTWPPRALPGGYMVPGWLRRDRSVEPAELFDRVGSEDYVYEVVDVGTLDEMVAVTERETRDKPRMWNRLAETFSPQVGAVTFYAVDVVSHRFYHTVEPESLDPAVTVTTAPGFEDIIPRTLRDVDRALGEILAGLTPGDHVVVVSDHGFQTNPSFFRRWGLDRSFLLTQGDVDPTRDGVSVANSFMNLSVEIEPGPAGERDAVLARLASFLTELSTLEGHPLFEVTIVREPEREPEAPRPGWMTEVMEYRLPAHAFLFALPVAETFDRAWPDGLVDVGGDPIPLSTFATPHDFTGDHHPVGIFLAAGPKIGHRSERLKLSVLDVAPLLFYLAGQPIPDDLEGKLQESLIEPDSLKRDPPRFIAAAEAPRLPDEDKVNASEDEEEIKRRLRALGYL